jgi:hypothetical protein
MVFSEYLKGEEICILIKNADGSVSQDYSVDTMRQRDDMA